MEHDNKDTQNKNTLGSYQETSALSNQTEDHIFQELDRRIRQARDQKTSLRTLPPFSGTQASLGLRMVIELMAGIAIGGGMGWGLGWLTGLSFLFVPFFFLLGLIAGIKTVLQTSRNSV